MLVHLYSETPTTASGAWAGNTPKFSGVLAKQLIVSPATATTEYDVQVENSKGKTIKRYDDSLGRLDVDLDTPLKGIYTIRITNATADEDFFVHLASLE